MRGIARWFVRVFATYQFEKMLAADIEQYKIRVQYLEDMLIWDDPFAQDHKIQRPLSDGETWEERTAMRDRITAERNTIIYRRQKQTERREYEKQLRSKQK